MKLSISNIAWMPEETNSIINILKRRKVQGIEVAPSLLFNDIRNLSGKEINKVRSFYESQGIEIVAMQALLYGRPDLCIFSDDANREKTIEYLKKIFEIAGQLGARSLVFGSPKNRNKNNLKNEEVKKISGTFFHRLGEMAIKQNTRLCIEPNATDYQCNFITNTMEAIELVKFVDHPGFRLHLDAGVMALNEENHVIALESALPYMSHFHISEPHLRKITENKSNHQMIGRTLNRLEYAGWVSIEMKSGLGIDNVDVVDECLEFAYRMYIKNE